jgi:predicted nucleic acid-binding protein
VARARYLVDTSVFSRLTKPTVAAAFAPLAVQGLVTISAPVAFELGFAARNAADHAALMDHLASFPSVPTTQADHERAIHLQAELATRGQHRALSLVDALVATVAEGRGLVVLHYDADFELVAAVTGQPHQWVVPRGTADG